jgi:esterase/lipase superfamily enzyme
VRRDYRKDWSGALGREMDSLRFGDRGPAVLAFPTSMGRFYQWEDFGLLGALADWIDAGRLQVWCVDSVDSESWYARERSPQERVKRHLQYERYVLEEVLPQLPEPPVAAGASFGALHAVLLATRHPTRVRGFVGMSGAFDTARWLDGHTDSDTYYTNPLAYLAGLQDEAYLAPLRAQHPKVLATGLEDPNVEDTRQLGRLLREKGVDVEVALWQGWAHDWPYWKEMLRQYLSG